MSNGLLVSEVFGPTVQGEGPSQGRPVTFVRLGLCNLDCRWCDTPYTWDWTGRTGKVYDRKEELERRNPTTILEDVLARGASHIVISGGEPLVQATGLVELVDLMYAHGLTVEIETNGTILLPARLMELGVGINCSPKLSSADITPERRLKPEVLAQLKDYGAAFKFVITSPDDLAEVDDIVTNARIPNSQVWLMPLGTTRDAILSALPSMFDLCAVRGWSLSPRLHVLAHGNLRGV